MMQLLFDVVLAGHAELLTVLIEHGAELDGTTTPGRTALHCAAARGHAESVTVLLACGASVAVKDGDGRTAYDLADKTEITGTLLAQLNAAGTRAPQAALAQATRVEKVKRRRLNVLEERLGHNCRGLWESEGRAGRDANKLFRVDPASAEYRKIVGEFRNTMPAHTVVEELLRVENGAVHELFQVNSHAIRQEVGAGFDPGRMERLLFHGTDAVEMIVNATDGHAFLPLKSGSANGSVWGEGIYFARDAAYSDRYVKHAMHINGPRRMLLVEVALGRSTQGARGMRVCPVLPGTQYTRYNSMVNDVANPSIFVVQHSSQCYPAYQITYRDNRPR